jgi:hypothetical protein
MTDFSAGDADETNIMNYYQRPLNSTRLPKMMSSAVKMSPGFVKLVSLLSVEPAQAHNRKPISGASIIRFGMEFCAGFP